MNGIRYNRNLGEIRGWCRW